jgi:hypothetical protein
LKIGWAFRFLFPSGRCEIKTGYLVFVRVVVGAVVVVVGAAAVVVGAAAVVVVVGAALGAAVF